MRKDSFLVWLSICGPSVKCQLSWHGQQLDFETFALFSRWLHLDWSERTLVTNLYSQLANTLLTEHHTYVKVAKSNKDGGI
jgi:hypothetical protein